MTRETIPAMGQIPRELHWHPQAIWRRQVTLGVICGLSNREMADALGVTRATIEGRLATLFRETGTQDRREFAAKMNAAIEGQRCARG